MDRAGLPFRLAMGARCFRSVHQVGAFPAAEIRPGRRSTVGSPSARHYVLRVAGTVSLLSTGARHLATARLPDASVADRAANTSPICRLTSTEAISAV